jgi:hypothetical protein
VISVSALFVTAVSEREKVENTGLFHAKCPTGELAEYTSMLKWPKFIDVPRIYGSEVTHSACTKNTSSIVAFQTEKYLSTLHGKMRENGTPISRPNGGGRLEGVVMSPLSGFCKSRD